MKTTRTGSKSSYSVTRMPSQAAAMRKQEVMSKASNHKAFQAVVTVVTGVSVETVVTGVAVEMVVTGVAVVTVGMVVAVTMEVTQKAMDLVYRQADKTQKTQTLANGKEW